MAGKKITKGGKTSKQEVPDTPVWEYRGYKLSTNDLAPAMGQLFNMAGQRAGAFRQRLDTTTNWAVISTGAMLSVSFSQPSIHHVIILINMFLVLWYLSIEAQRYKNFELWDYRVRQIEADFYLSMLIPPFQATSAQLEKLTENLLIPRHQISIWEAFSRRLRRRYLLIFFVLLISWIFKNWLFPTAPNSLQELIMRTAVGTVSGPVMVILVLLFYAFLLASAFGIIPLTIAIGKILPHFGRLNVFIVTNKVEAISTLVLANFGRKVSEINEDKMFVGTVRTVLSCTLEAAQAEKLKSAVIKQDSQAFVIVEPRMAALSRAFNPRLQE